MVNDLISRQAAIDAANDWLLDCLKVQKQDRSCGLIRRLENLPSAQPDMSEYSSKLWRNAYERGKRDTQQELSQVARDIATIIENEQDMRVIERNAQPERKTGKWIPLTSASDEKHHEWCGYQCSICGERTPRLALYNFCSNCGADMRGEQNESD